MGRTKTDMSILKGIDILMKLVDTMDRDIFHTEEYLARTKNGCYYIYSKRFSRTSIEEEWKLSREMLELITDSIANDFLQKDKVIHPSALGKNQPNYERIDLSDYDVKNSLVDLFDGFDQDGSSVRQYYVRKNDDGFFSCMIITNQATENDEWKLTYALFERFPNVRESYKSIFGKEE